MTTENNRKYIAEAWVDNEKEQEFIKSYLQSLLEQWEGHGNGFDADTVDEMHWEDIQQTIIDMTQGFVDAFQIGYTKISSDAFQYYLGFEAIKLYNIDADGASNEDKQLPWSSELYTERDSIPNLHQVIEKLYELSYFGDSEYFEELDEENPDCTERTNKCFYESLYKSFKNKITNLENRMDPLETLVNSKIINGNLDADTVNGIRFFIYTEEEYAALEESAAEYDPESDENDPQAEQDYFKLHSINNVFILTTQEELIRNGYDGYYPNNPDIAVISRYYQFRVHTNEVTSVKELQYKFESESENDWHYMCNVRDFLDEDEIRTKLIEILGSNTSYSLNPTAVLNALQGFIQVLKETYIKGAFYDFVSESDKTMVPIRRVDNYNYLDLTPFEEYICDKIDDVEGHLSDYKIRLEGQDNNSGIIGDLRAEINSLKGDITLIKGTSLPNLQNQINTLSSQLSNLQNSIVNSRKWTVVDKSNHKIYYNNYEVVVSISLYVNSNRPHTYTLGTIGTENLRPQYNISAPTHSIGSYGDPYGYIKVNTDGKVLLVLSKDAYNKNGGVTLYGAVNYPRK